MGTIGSARYILWAIFASKALKKFETVQKCGKSEVRCFGGLTTPAPGIVTRRPMTYRRKRQRPSRRALGSIRNAEVQLRSRGRLDVESPWITCSNAQDHARA